MSDSLSSDTTDVTKMIHDPERLAALRHAQILDSIAEEAFDRLTRLASKIIGAPVALISLVDEERQFFKSSVGLQEPWASLRETPLTHSFCQYAVASGEPLVISDAREHPLVHENLAIRDLGVIAYAGVPLVTDEGQALGSLCVIDAQPREWAAHEIDILRDLAAMAMSEIALRIATHEAELRAAEAEQQREQKAAILERLNRVVETNANGITVVDMQGHFTFANSAAEQILGVARGGLVGRSYNDPAWHITTVDGKPFPDEELPVTQVLRAGQPIANVEMAMTRPDGTRVILGVNAAPLQGEGAVVAFVDKTDHKHAEAVQRVLVQAGSMLADTLDYDEILSRVARLGVPEFADWCAAYIVQDGQLARLSVVHAEPAKEDILRAIQQQLPVWSEHENPVVHVLNAGEPLRVVNPLQLLPDGIDTTAKQMLQEIGFCSLLCVPLKARGRMLGALIYVSAEPDCPYTHADLMVAQELARRAALALDNARLYQEAQQAVQSRDDLFSMVTHDLKNPLTTINGYADVLQRRVKRMNLPDPSRLTEGLARIRQAGDKMTQQLNELLDTAIIRSGGMLELQRDPLNLVTLVQTICAEQQQVAQHNDVRFESSDTELMGYFDARRLERVFTNLIANAVKYSTNGTPVDVVATHQYEQESDWAMIMVKDQGIGVPAADLPHIFDRFQRGSNVGSIKGSGIGLATVASIVEQHGGYVAVESAEGMGTTFIVRLPLIALSQVEPAAQNSGL